MGFIASARHAAAATAALCVSVGAQAAGGHHAVDDATIMERGNCEEENWVSRYQGGTRLFHAGVNCRVGPVELDGAAEYARGDGESATEWNLEIKWAKPLGNGWAVGLDLEPVWAAHQSPRYAATRFTALATWGVTEGVDLHFNAGRDWLRGERDFARYGVGMDWAPIARWSFVLERYLDLGTHFVRTGARWAAGRQWTVDLSYAQRLSGPAPSFWTLGLTFDLDED